MRYINEIIIHCTATPPGMDVGVKEINAWHLARGWKGCGYHYVVRLDGTVERGRYLSQPGAHCSGHNAHSIGIAYVGGVDDQGRPRDTRTEAQKTALRQLIAKHVNANNITRIRGHRDYAAKACPCFDAKKEYENMAKTILSKKIR